MDNVCRCGLPSTSIHLVQESKSAEVLALMEASICG